MRASGNGGIVRLVRKEPDQQCLVQHRCLCENPVKRLLGGHCEEKGRVWDAQLDF